MSFQIAFLTSESRYLTFLSSVKIRTFHYWASLIYLVVNLRRKPFVFLNSYPGSFKAQLSNYLFFPSTKTATTKFQSSGLNIEGLLVTSNLMLFPLMVCYIYAHLLNPMSPWLSLYYPFTKNFSIFPIQRFPGWRCYGTIIIGFFFCSIKVLILIFLS